MREMYLAKQIRVNFIHSFIFALSGDLLPMDARSRLKKQHMLYHNHFKGNFSCELLNKYLKWILMSFICHRSS